MKPVKQVWLMVVQDMLARNEDGATKYNRYLTSDCPDDMLQHLYEELLDACVYIKTVQLQNDDLHDRILVLTHALNLRQNNIQGYD